MRSTAKRLEVQVEERPEFDGCVGKGIRERAGYTVGQLVDEIKENYPLDRVSLCNIIYRIEHTKPKLKFIRPGDFKSNYLLWIMKREGYNPCEITLKDLQPPVKK